MTAAPEGTNDSGNGRVTLAVIGAKLDALTEAVGDLIKDFKSDHDKLTVLCTKQERLDIAIKAMVGAVVSAIGAALWALMRQ